MAYYGPTHIEVARIHSQLATVHERMGDVDAALESCVRDYDVTAEALGRDHIDLAT